MNTALLKAAFKQPSANKRRLCTVHVLHLFCSQSTESLAVGFAASICILDHHLDLKHCIDPWISLEMVKLPGNQKTRLQYTDIKKTWHWNWWSCIACMSFYYVGAVLMLDARLYGMWTMGTISSAKALSARSTCCGSCGREEVKWSYRSNTTFWSGTGYELFLLLGHWGHCSLSIQKALSGPAAIVGCLPRPARQPGQVPDYSDNKNPINEHRHSIA